MARLRKDFNTILAKYATPEETLSGDLNNNHMINRTSSMVYQSKDYNSANYRRHHTDVPA